LPEVETIRRDLATHLAGRTISDFRVRDQRLVSSSRAAGWKDQIVGQRCEAFERLGKYLSIRLTGGSTLVLHLRMTGQLVIGVAAGDSAWRAWFEFDDGQTLGFLDQRRFGELWLLRRGEAWPAKHTPGPDALTQLEREFFVEGLKRRSTRIQPLMMDQSFISGIGNIYAQEALFKALIRPSRPAKRVRTDEAHRLFDALQETLLAAIAHRGSSSRNYRDAWGAPGSAQSLHAVYRKGGGPCPRCGILLKAARIGGRGSVYCPRCQK
jgi:formamidopyrimidine-DNA glycosylase